MLTEFKGTVIIELEERGTFRLQFFKFRNPLRSDYSVSFENIEYMLHSKTEGALLLVPLTRLDSQIGEEIEELINSYPNLKSEGVAYELKAEEEKKETYLEGYELMPLSENKEYF